MTVAAKTFVPPEQLLQVKVKVYDIAPFKLTEAGPVLAMLK